MITTQLPHTSAPTTSDRGSRDDDGSDGPTVRSVRSAPKTASKGPPKGPPAGSLQGHTATILHAMVRVRGNFTNTHRLILDAMLARCYEYTPMPEDWAEVRSERPWLGWTRTDQTKLAEELQMSVGTLSSQLTELVEHGVLVRGDGEDFAYISFAHPDRWDAALFDQREALNRHARDGAGRPKAARPSDPSVPLEERASDKFGKPFLALDEFREALADHNLDEKMLLTLWRFAEHFQTVCDDSWDTNWTKDLYALLVQQDWTVAQLNVKIHQQLRNAQISRHWGYLLSTISNGPHLKPATTAAAKEDNHEDQPSRSGAHQQSRHVAPAPTDLRPGRFGGSAGRQPRRAVADDEGNIPIVAIGG